MNGWLILGLSLMAAVGFALIILGSFYKKVFGPKKRRIMVTAICVVVVLAGVACIITGEVFSAQAIKEYAVTCELNKQYNEVACVVAREKDDSQVKASLYPILVSLDMDIMIWQAKVNASLQTYGRFSKYFTIRDKE